MKTSLYHRLSEAVRNLLETQWENATIPTVDFDRLIGQVQQGLADPTNEAKLELARIACILLQEKYQTASAGYQRKQSERGSNFITLVAIIVFIWAICSYFK